MRIDARRGRVPGAQARISGVGGVASKNALTGLAEVAAPIVAALERGDRLKLAQLQQQASVAFNDEFDGLAREYDGSEPGFEETVRERISARAEALIETEPARRQGEARARLDQLVTRQLLAAQRVEGARRDQYVARGIREFGDSAVNQIASDPSLYDSFQDAVDDAVADAPGALRGALRDELQNNLANAYGRARLEADPHGLVEDLNAGALDERLNGSSKANLLKAAEREIDRRQREAELAQARRHAELRARAKAEADDIDQILETFGAVSDERLSEFQALANEVDDPAMVAEIQEKVLHATEAARISELSPVEGQKRVDAIKAQASAGDGPDSAVAARLVETMQRAVNGKKARLSDVVGSGVSEGRIAPLSPDTLSVSALNQRAAEAQAYARENDVAPNILSESERDVFASYLSNDPNGFTVATGLAGTRVGDQMLAEVFPKQPGLTHLAGLAANGAEAGFINDARAGLQARREKGFQSSIPRARAREAVRAIVGAATILDPAFHDAVIDMANAAYETRRFQQNADPDELDHDLYERVLNESVGARFDRQGVQYGGFTGVKTAYGDQVVIAPHWMQADRFERKYTRLTDDQLVRAANGEAVTGDGLAIRTRDLLRGVPVPVGAGRYRVRFGSDAFAVTSNGEPFEIDLNKIRAELE